MWQYLSFLIILVLGWVFYKITSGIFMPVVKKILGSYLNSSLLDNQKILSIAQAISLLFLFWIIRILIPVLQLPIAAAELSILVTRIILTIFAVILAIRIIRLVMDYAMNFAIRHGASDGRTTGSNHSTILDDCFFINWNLPHTPVTQCQYCGLDCRWYQLVD